ncbi:SAFB-like transcription modulator [Bactrocera tryoni]|uniref:SAFB-like transcription modulator n=1 Tax=Bactrocera tryoni TaxID=59916 RepID=UPI001A97758D|nr:SAFB-like transcription modulator [Bactrocera tryoni]
MGKALKKVPNEFDTNHEKLMADGIGEEDYFKKNEYNNTMIKIEEAINALKMSILKDKPLVEFDRQIETVQIRCTNPDQKTSIFMRKIENLRRKMEDLSMELTIDNDQIKGLDCLFNDIQNLKSKLDFNVEIEDIFEKICDEYYEDLQNLKRKLKKEEPKISFRPNFEERKIIKIPTFYGDIKEWANFYNVFQVMVHDNEQMPNIEKMLRLRQCLKGEAARVIQHFQISSKNYEAAWSQLKKKYDNQPILFIIPKLSTTATKLINAVQNIEDEKLITVRSLPLSSVEEKTTEIIEEDKKENEFEEEFFEELHKRSKTEESYNLISLPAGSHFGKMWENEVQVKSFEDETEVADHILEDDAKTQKEDFTTSQKYIKEKCTDAEGDNTGRNSAPKNTKTVAALKDTRTSKGGSSSIKDERQWSKPDDDKSKRKDEKSGDKKDKDISEQKSSSNKTSQKDDKVNTSTKLSSKGKQTKPSRNLLVSGLSSLTRASDLKTIFSKYGKVIGAKVVTNSRTPGTRCYGYVAMSSSSDTSRSVAKRRVDTTKKDEDKKIRDTTSKTRDDKQTIDTKDDASKKPEVEKDKQRDKEILFQDHNKKDVSKTIKIAEIDPVGKADVVTTIWELLIPWQLALTNETSITICG